ncbi:hypothetical protein [Chryseobacterium sp.]|uniref:hypothetical protein n=1 Tax=Chryseobacterium sp. TaxID=1871047 RepID=UPI0031E1D670
MRNVMSITALFCSAFLYTQNLSDTTDQLIDKMCLDLKDNESLNDSLKIESINQKFILPYLAQFTDSERQDKFDQIYFRLQIDVSPSGIIYRKTIHPRLMIG